MRLLMNVSMVAETVTVGLPPHIAVYRRGSEACLLNTRSLRVLYVAGDSLDTGVVEVPAGFVDVPVLNVPEPSLSTFQVSVTLDCNMACTYCIVAENSWGDIPHKMPLERAVGLSSEADRELPQGGLLYITGGEPLLNWEATSALLSGTRHDLVKVVVTNATLVTPEKASLLAEKHACVLVSIDGDAVAHNATRRYRGGQSTFDCARRGFDLLRTAGCAVGVSLVVGPHNASRLADVADYLLETLAPDSIGIGLPHSTERHVATLNAGLLAEEYGRVFDLVLARPTFVDQIARRLLPFATESFRFRDCSACGSKIVVFPDGTRSNCVSAGPARDLVVSNAKWRGRIPLWLEECEGCAAIGVCGGGCTFDGLSLYDGVDQRNCAITKTLLERFVWALRDATDEQMPSPETKAAVFADLLDRPSALAFSVGHSQ